MPVAKLNRRTVEALRPADRVVTYYDDALKGFGLKVQPSGARSWFVEYRPGAGGRSVAKKRIVLGAVDTLPPEQARAEAAKLLAGVRLGADPAAARQAERADITVAELCDRYLRDGVDHKKASTLATDRGRIERHIKPLIGRRKIGDVTRTDIEKFLRDVANGKTAADVKTKLKGRAIVTGGRGTATRTVRLLGGIFTWAVGQKLRADNPVAGVKKYADKAGERFLTTDELQRLGDAIREAETIGIEWVGSTSKHAPKTNPRTKIDPHAAAALRLLIFTGCRVSEILNLRWSEADLERGILFLPDSKTGRKAVVLSSPAIAILSELPRIGSFVIAGRSAGTNREAPRSDLKRPWSLVRRRAGIEGVRLHDLRHSFASVGAGSGLGLPIIGKLLGHADVKTTARYAHLATDPVRAAADAIAGQIADAMGEKA